ncbi:hypothetical protein [Maribacter sp.]|uniref:hypothetical protein n=1 Tax=Maribacter sp. TaxID=1897614 RepID=UPI003296F8A3
MIFDFKDFAKYKYEILNNKLPDSSESGIVFTPTRVINSEILSDNLSFIEFNNYDFNESTIHFLNTKSTYLNQISHLSFWNSKIIDLSLLHYFKKVEFLSVSHIAHPNFSFTGIEYLENLKTLCLLKTGKIKDFKSIVSNNTIENFSIIQPANIKQTSGLGNLKGLKYLNIEGSANKIYHLETLNEIETLASIEKIKLRRVKIPFQELMSSLKLPRNIEFEIDANIYETEEYKELSQELKNVKSSVFNPYIERRDFFEPIGKGKRVIKKTDKKLVEKLERLQKEWGN